MPCGSSLTGHILPANANRNTFLLSAAERIRAERIRNKQKGVNTLPETVTKEQARKFYETMCTIRCFEESVKRDFLNGEIPGFVHLYIGEEAIATGVCGAMRKTDFLQSTHRGHGHCVAKGADVNKMMAEIFGKKDGLCKGKGGSMHIADFSVGMIGANGVVGGGYNIATGAALASKMILKNDNVSVVFFGDGAANRGTFHEAANVASAWKLPVVFVNEMNCWASTTPYRTTTALENISDRALGYHMPGVIVDGQNVFEVYETTGKLTGAIGGGGRYDKMITDFIDDGNTYPAIGISFGLTSIFALLKDREDLNKPTNIDIYIIPMNTKIESLKLANELRNLGYNVEIEMEDKKLKKSLDFCNKEQIPYVIILGEDEITNKVFKIKNMLNREEIEIDFNNINKIKEMI